MHSNSNKSARGQNYKQMASNVSVLSDLQHFDRSCRTCLEVTCQLAKPDAMFMQSKELSLNSSISAKGEANSCLGAVHR